MIDILDFEHDKKQQVNKLSFDDSVKFWWTMYKIACKNAFCKVVLQFYLLPFIFLLHETDEKDFTWALQKRKKYIRNSKELVQNSHRRDELHSLQNISYTYV